MAKLAWRSHIQQWDQPTDGQQRHINDRLRRQLEHLEQR